MSEKCCVPGCRRVSKVKGMCGPHHYRALKGQSLETPVRKRVDGSIAKRLKGHLKVDRKSGCHQWYGARNSDGYGLINIGGKNRPAHRVAFELANGAIPEGLVVMHTCDNRRCCNPEHLKLGTRADNSRDRWAKGRKAGCRALDLEKNPQWAAPAPGGNSVGPPIGPTLEAIVSALERIELGLTPLLQLANQSMAEGVQDVCLSSPQAPASFGCPGST